MGGKGPAGTGRRPREPIKSEDTADDTPHTIGGSDTHQNIMQEWATTAYSDLSEYVIADDIRSPHFY
jgi:hypothetical protein